MELAVYYLSLAGFCFLNIVAAIGDVRRFIIPNWISIALVALYPFYALTTPIPFSITPAFLAAGIAFGVGFALFALGLFGGGDVKMLTAVALWAGSSHLMDLLLVTVLAGGLVALVVVACHAGRRMRRSATAGSAPGLSGRQLFNHKIAVPYGVGIAIGGIALLAEMPLPGLLD
ncbi:A24 family peptidase [Oceanibacterium hippocampi]|uniref:Type IV leader peptidase family protein n=1 Tax=Oceanibacterium hippocampi TaxID=745714 RepID=A0A1Y5SAT9_9PROT|nr:prepilin peptidase [Oceanibacterium hippocampi]SLN36473.1 Type IV leader peptidase family protein [Oceanibacterium hippocampi]